MATAPMKSKMWETISRESHRPCLSTSMQLPIQLPLKCTKRIPDPHLQNVKNTRNLPRPIHCHTSQSLNSNISSNRCLRHRSKRSKDMQRSRTSQRCRVVCKDCLKPWQETTKHLESEVLPCLWWPWCRHGVAMVFPMGSAPWHN